MADLYARLGDDFVPLTDCAWMLRAPCGCVRAIGVAASTDGWRTVASPEDAIAAYDWTDGLSVAGMRHAGYKVELVEFETARSSLAFNCEHEVDGDA